jgi:tRNA A-37 threonylcarbamoyl transferase component Bud32
MSSRTPESRSELLAQLRADQSQRWQRGERVPVEHYLGQYPELSGDTEALVELIQSELLRRREAGEQPALDEYLARFPDQTELLRRSWPALSAPPTKAWADSHSSGTTVAESRPASAPPPATPGLRLPGLELGDKLGEGGMGFVYRARDVRLDQPRAIKVIRRGSFGTAEAHERFNREAKAVARLDHPGVVRIYQLGEHEDTLYICMECVEGGSLQARLREGPLEPRAAAELVARLALAVQHAHDNHVLHRDLKPGNVLLTAAGEPKVSDFGLAKLLDTDDDLTAAGAVLGTPSYMAPEQAEGRASEVREGTDVWALGAILYECLTGRPPFRGETRSETLEQVRLFDPATPRQLRPDIPAELERICLKCLEKDPSRRYASAAELAAGLRDWLDDRTVLLQRAPKPRGVGRRRLAVGLAALVAVGLAAGLYFLPRGGPPQPPPAPPTTAKPPPGPGEWQDLLTREPTRLRWPDWMKKEMHYDPAARTLHVSASDLGLVSLGQTAAPRWRLAAKFQQAPWAGNVGLYFGYRAETIDDAPADQYQVIQLVFQGDDDKGGPLRLDWRKEAHRGAGRQERLVADTVMSSPGFRLSPGEHRLEITVGPGGLEAVALDGAAQRGLRSDAVGRPPPAADFAGRFGIFVRNGNGNFSEIRYLYYEEPQ